MLEWLPEANREARTREALQLLGDRTLARHQDPWLRDFLRSVPPVETAGLLASAIEQNLAGEAAAHATAVAAAAQLRRGGQRSGALRAEVEATYALYRAQRYADCASTGKTAEREARSAGYHWLAARLLLEIGNCEAALGQEGNGVSAGEQVWTQSQQYGYPVLAWRAQALLKGLATNWGDQNAAWEGTLPLLAAYRTAPFPAALAYRAYADLSTAAQARGHIQAAYALRRAAVRELAATANRPLEGIARSRLAGLAALAGDRDAARSEAQTALTLLTDAPSRARAELALAESEMEDGRGSEALARLDRAFPPDQPATVPYVALRVQQTRGQAHYQQSDWAGARQAFELAVQVNERRLAALNAGQDRAAPVRDADAAYRGLVQLALREGHPDEALRLMQWQRAADLPGPRRDPRPADLARALTSETVLAYVRLPEGLALWSIDDRGTVFHRLNVNAAQLAPVVERFARQCADPRSQAAARQRDAAQLYQWLIAPVAARLDPARTLVIESDELLGLVPWRALVDERFALVAGRGLAAYTERAARDLRVTPATSLLAMADPALPGTLRASFPPLPHALAEAEFVRTLFRPAMLIAQDAATAAALREYRPRAQVFHFAGHGTPQGLLLASGPGRVELLRADAITGQDWRHCRLVVLSACSSGTGERYGLVNPESLVRSFLNAGVGRVLATSWNADSASAAQLAQTFYTALSRGDEPASALRQAAQELRRNAATSHPYYWAGYQLFGYK